MFKKLILLFTVGATAIAAAATPSAPTTGDYFYGLNYGINQNACPTYEQIKSDFQTIKQYTNRVRTFSLSVCNEGQMALQAANELGMNIYLGMWIDTQATFDAEMAALNSIAASGQSFSKVDAIIVGSEVLYRNDTDEQSLANYIQKVGAIVRPKGIKVTTADVYYEFPPVVVAQLDFLMMNAFPYWEGVTADQGATTLMNHYQSVVTGKANGKPVHISETGWPDGSSNFGASIASSENQQLYLSNVLCQTRKNNINMLYFSAIDEPYKAGVEAHWGIMNSNKTLKADIPISLLQNPTC